MSSTHRRYTRLQILQEATIALPGGLSLGCEIKNFCPKGLNLCPIDSLGRQFPAAFMDAADAIVTVAFSVDGHESSQRFEFPGKIVRGTPRSIGLFADEMPAKAYKALVQVRSSLFPPEQAPSGLLEAESQAIVEDCIKTFQEFLSDAWQRFFDKVKTRLRERDATPFPLSEQSQFLNVLSDLNRDRKEFSARHFNLIINRIHRLGQASQENKVADQEAELAFIDEALFEDWLNISAVFNSQEGEIRTPMYEFEHRLSRIFPTRIDKGNDPFGPESVCLAFQETLRGMDMTNAMRAVIYHLFGESIACGYPELYDQFVQLAAPIKLDMPRAVHAPEHAKHAKRAPGGGEDVANHISKLADLAERLLLLYPPTLSDHPAEADTGSSHEAAVPAQGQDGQPPEGGRRTPALQEPERLWALLHQALSLDAQGQRLPANGMASSTPTAPNGAQPQDQGRSAVNIEDLLVKLAGEPDDHAAHDAFSMRNAPLSQALATLLSREDSATRLAQPQYERLGRLTNLIAHASAEQPAASQIEAMLVRLERPLYESILSSDELLRLPDHPLRRLFNLVDRFAIVADDSGRFLDQDLFGLVDSIIEHVSTQTAPDVAMFAHACENLEKLLKHGIQQHHKRVASYQELCESQRLQKDARRHVAEMLDKHWSGRDVPTFVIRLLDQGWRHHLVMTQLRGIPEAIDAAFAVLDQLARVLAGDTTTAAARNDLIDRIEEGLLSTSIDRPRTEALLGELTTMLSSGVLRLVEVKHIASGSFASGIAPKRLHTPDSASRPELPGIGDWWDFKLENKLVPMQLIWTDRSAAMLAFANRSATRKMDMSLADLNRMIQRGEASQTESRDIPLLERSEYGVVDSVFRNLSRESARDPVTGMLNSKGWLNAIQRCNRPDGSGRVEHSFCLLEFYPIHLVYDSCGVEAANSLMRELATALRSAVGEEHPIAVIHDGVFALLLSGLNLESVRRFAERLLGKFGGYHFRHDTHSFAINLAIGLVGCEPGMTDIETVMRRGLAACNTARTLGGDRIEVYEDKGERLREHESLMDWAGKIDTILADDSLYLRCQRIEPIGAPASLRSYYEILLGIRQTKGPEVSPQAFIQAVELWKRSRDIDLWVANRAFRWIREHPDVFATIGGFSINLSATSLADAQVLAALELELGAGDLPTEKIMFEITETATLAGYGSARDFMRKIRRYGCKFCIDDFGSGNASYGYLKNLSTDTLKIDGAYVKDILSNPNDLALVRSMNDIGHSLGMKTVAEYAANAEIVAVLKDIGVDYVQGYAVHIPSPLDGLLAA